MRFWVLTAAMLSRFSCVGLDRAGLGRIELPDLGRGGVELGWVILRWFSQVDLFEPCLTESR